MGVSSEHLEWARAIGRDFGSLDPIVVGISSDVVDGAPTDAELVGKFERRLEPLVA